MANERPSRSRRKGPSALALTSLALIAGAAAVVAWLALTDTGSGPDRTDGPALTMTLPAPIIEVPAAPGGTGGERAAPTPEAAPAEPEPAESGPASSGASGPPQTPDPAPDPTPDRSDTPERSAEAPGAPDVSADMAVPEAPDAPAEKASPEQTAQAARPRLPETAGDGLSPAPDPDLLETGRFGPLPKVSDDGRKAWQAYARPFDVNDQRPRIAIVIENLGLSGAATEAAIQRLPGAVTLAFAPYANELANWIKLARAGGHEVMLNLPMEPVNFPANDPGPHTLLTRLTDGENATRLHWLLGRVTGYVGVINQMGSRFTTSKQHLKPILSEIRDRGLLFLDSRSSLRSVAAETARELDLPRVINSRFIDAEASRDAIDERLGELERIAKVSGFAVGVGEPFPVTIERLVLWTRSLGEKGIALAPVSAMVNTQTD